MRAQHRLEERNHMRQPWTGLGTALVTPFTPTGAVDEPAVRRLARRRDRRGRPLPGAVRHDWGEPNAHARGAPARRGTGARRGSWTCARPGWRGRLQHRGGGRPRPRARGPRGPGHPFGDALLQQADAGRPRPPLRAHCLAHRASHHPLQRAGPDGLQHRAPHRSPASRPSRTSSGSRKRRAT